MTPSQMQSAIERQPEELRRILGDTASLDLAIRRLEGADRIVLVGTGTSWHAANHGVWFLREAGVPSVAAQTMDAVLYPDQVFVPGDAVVILSHGNSKKYTVALGERLRESDHPPITIGGIDAANIDIPTVERERSAAFTFSHTAAMLRVAQLAARLSGVQGDLESIPEVVESALSAELAVAIPSRGVELIGAGGNQWTAAEGALKIREAAYIAAEGLSVEQFLHGPAAATDARDLLVALRSHGPGLQRVDDVTRGAEVAGLQVLRIGPFDTNEALSVFPLTIGVQRVALDLALRSNVNPDLFRTETHNAWKDVGL